MRAIGDLQAVEHHHRQAHVLKPAAHQFPKRSSCPFDEHLRDRALPGRGGRLLDLLADGLPDPRETARGNTGEHPVHHRPCQRIAISEVLIRRDRQLPLVIGRAHPGPTHLHAPAAQRHRPVLVTVPLGSSIRGAYVTAFGSKGSGNGQFDETYGIAADPASGNLYVADADNNRVQEFTAKGTFVTKYGSEGSGNGQFKYPLGVSVNSEGSIYVGDFGNSRIEEFEPVPSTPAYTSTIGSVGSGNGQFKEPKGVDMAKNGNLFVLDSSNSRVQELSPSGTYLNKFGSSGTGSGQMKGPAGMTVDTKGDVWVADTGNDRVDEFNEKREFVQAFGWGVSNGEEKLEVCTSTCEAGLAGAGTGELKEPKGVAVAPNGDVYVSDTGNNRVEEFSEKGEFIAAFGFGVTNEKAEFEICTKECKAGTAGSGNGQFSGPLGIAIAPDGDLWVADKGNNRVEEFNEKDEYVSKFGSKGSEDGQFKEPKGIAIDAAGNVWVADTMNGRVQEFTPSGTFLTVFGDRGTGNAQFEETWGIALVAGGAVYVADVKNNRVQEWARAPRPGNEGAHDVKTIYYTAGTEAEVSSCRNHPGMGGPSLSDRTGRAARDRGIAGTAGR